MGDGRAPLDDVGINTEEGRPTDDVVRDLLAFYALLSSSARRSLRAQVVLGRTEQQAALGKAVGRLIVRHGFDLFRTMGAEWTARAYPGDWPATEEEIAEEAVRLVREAHARLARS